MGACSMYMCNFDLEHVKVISGSFSILLSKLGHLSETVNRRVKRMKIWSFLDHRHVNVIWRSFCAYSSHSVQVPQN